MQKNRCVKLVLFYIFGILNVAHAMSITNTGNEELIATFNNPTTGAEVYKTQIGPGTLDTPTTKIINHNFNTNTVDVILFYRLPARVTAVYSAYTNSTCNITARPIKCKFWEIWCSETKPDIQLNGQCGNPTVE